MMTERFIIFNGHCIPPYIHPDHPVTRSETVSLIASGENMTDLHSVISFELGRPSVDVTASIVAEVLERWDDRGEPLSARAYEFVERFGGMHVARGFAVEEEELV